MKVKSLSQLKFKTYLPKWSWSDSRLYFYFRNTTKSSGSSYFIKNSFTLFS